MTIIKICGITAIEQALAAAEAGADFLGFVFATSPRQISPERVTQIIDAVHYVKPPSSLVGVFVNSPVAEVNRIAENCRLDYVQLSGDESWKYCLEIERPIIKAMHVTNDKNIAQVISEIEQGQILMKREFICLLDTQIHKNVYGGSGQAFDWQLAKEVSARFPIFIAGGLTPVNITGLVQDVKPWGVDVSSGVETGGQKDIAKIKAFIEAVQKAEQ